MYSEWTITTTATQTVNT